MPAAAGRRLDRECSVVQQRGDGWIGSVLLLHASFDATHDTAVLTLDRAIAGWCLQSVVVPDPCMVSGTGRYSFALVYTVENHRILTADFCAAALAPLDHPAFSDRAGRCVPGRRARFWTNPRGLFSTPPPPHTRKHPHTGTGTNRQHTLPLFLDSHLL